MLDLHCSATRFCVCCVDGLRTGVSFEATSRISVLLLCLLLHKIPFVPYLFDDSPCKDRFRLPFLDGRLLFECIPHFVSSYFFDALLSASGA